MDANNKTWTIPEGGVKSLSNLDLVRLSKAYRPDPVQWRLDEQCADSRQIQSGVQDIPDEETYYEYAQEFYDTYAEDLFDE